MAANLVPHGIRRLGVLGAGQMGMGIALVSALRAKVPVLLYDRSPEQVTKGFSLADKLLLKDVNKGRITSEEAKEARDRIQVVGQEAALQGMRDADMVVEAVSENLGLKQKIFAELGRVCSDKTILASNTSSISITKIASSVIPEGVAASSEVGKKAAERVVGLHFFNPVPVMVSA
jgi:3-hydroxybutyryl-CoA dehydrogenase